MPFVCYFISVDFYTTWVVPFCFGFNISVSRIPFTDQCLFWHCNDQIFLHCWSKRLSRCRIAVVFFFGGVGGSEGVSEWVKSDYWMQRTVIFWTIDTCTLNINLFLQLYDAINQRYEVPVPMPKRTSKASDPKYTIAIKKDPLSLKIRRKDNGVVM